MLLTHEAEAQTHWSECAARYRELVEREQRRLERLSLAEREEDARAADDSPSAAAADDAAAPVIEARARL